MAFVPTNYLCFQNMQNSVSVPLDSSTFGLRRFAINLEPASTSGSR